MVRSMMFPSLTAEPDRSCVRADLPRGCRRRRIVCYQQVRCRPTPSIETLTCVARLAGERGERSELQCISSWAGKGTIRAHPRSIDNLTGCLRMLFRMRRMGWRTTHYAGHLRPKERKRRLHQYRPKAKESASRPANTVVAGRKWRIPI